MHHNTRSTSGQAPEHPSPLQKMWILGAGRFGAIAAERLSKRHPAASFLVVDAVRDRLAEIERHHGLPVHQDDAVSFLAKENPSPDTWIVPAVPVHVAFLWILEKLSRRGKALALPVPEAADSQVPNPYRVPSGTLYASFATFRCPDACSEPADICTHTGKPRLGNLFQVLGDVRVQGWKDVVIRSHQLAPGVGGYTYGRLLEVLKEIRGEAGKYLVSTACRCHGVMDGLQWDG